MSSLTVLRLLTTPISKPSESVQFIYERSLVEAANPSFGCRVRNYPWPRQNSIYSHSSPKMPRPSDENADTTNDGTSQHSSPQLVQLDSEVESFPDSGYGWIVVVSCFTLNCFTWGVTSVCPQTVRSGPPG